MTSKKLPHGISMWKDGKRHVIRVGKKFLGRQAKAYKKFFSSEKTALAFIKGLEEKQSGDFKTAETLEITPHQMAEVRIALQKIGSTPLLDVVDFWEKAEKPTKKPPTIAAAITDLLSLKEVEGTGPRHRKDTKEKLEYLFDGLMEETITAFDHKRMLKLITIKDGHGKAPSPEQRAKRIRYLNILFNDAVAQGYINRNPLDGIKPPRKVKKPLFILPPDQVAHLLWNCQQQFPAMLPLLAIKCFSGVRNEEMFKLTWGDVKQSIIVQASYAKTGRRRSVTIFPILQDWLNQCERGKDDELVFSLRPKRKSRPSAWYIEMKPIALAAGLVPWPQNGLRHLFGSYHLAWKQDDGLTAYEMGNSIGVVKADYTDAVTPEACKAFWDLTPLQADFIVTGERSGRIDTDEGDPDE